MTVLEVLTAASGYLEKHSIESPRLNAEHLLAHVLGKKRLDLYLEFDRPLSEAERAPLRDLIRDRATGKPLQHLLGTAEFFGRSFLCDGRALIPRPETEQLVELVLALLPRPGTDKRVLDIGTGTGVIALTIALERPEASVEAIDISSDALALARQNAARLSLDHKVLLHEGDLMPPGTEPFDIIVANLPYIATADLEGLQKEVQHDPRRALDGGPDGLVIIDRLISAALSRLRPSGSIVLEIGHDQAERTVELFRKGGYAEPSIHSDFQGVQRFVSARLPS